MLSVASIPSGKLRNDIASAGAEIVKFKGGWEQVRHRG